MPRSLRWVTLALWIPGLCLVLSSPALYGSGAAVLVVGPNVKVIHDNKDQPCPSANDLDSSFDCDNLQQNEPTIAVDPTNPDILVAGSNDYRLALSDKFSKTIWLGYYRSTDGGKTWSNSFIPGFPGDRSPEGQASPLHGFASMSDPVLAFDRNGNAFYTGLIIPKDEDTGQWGVVVARYTNHGAVYAGTSVVSLLPTGLFSDKPCMAIDDSGGPHDGSIYLAWTRDPGIITFARSTDHGKTFSSQVISPPNLTINGVPIEVRGCSITTDFKGNVYVFWRLQNICDFFPEDSTCELYAGSQTEGINLVVSEDGGQFFGPVITIQQIHPFDQIDDTFLFRHRSFPTAAADAQNVYVVWEDRLVDQGARVLISCFNDQGMHWQKPVAVDLAMIGHQVMPTVTVADGLIKVAWYDSRNDPQFSLADPALNSLDVYYAEAPTGCPTHFPAESVRVTDKSFDPNLRMFAHGTAPFIGDYIGIASGGGKTHVIWTDNRDVQPQPVTDPSCDPDKPETLISGCRNQNIYTATISK
jgi:hypothetical protein